MSGEFFQYSLLDYYWYHFFGTQNNNSYANEGHGQTYVFTFEKKGFALNREIISLVIL